MRTSRLENNKVLQKKKQRKKEAIQINSFLIWCGYFGELLHKSSPHSIYGPKMTFERDIFLVFRIRYVFFHRRIYHHGLLWFFFFYLHFIHFEFSFHKKHSFNWICQKMKKEKNDEWNKRKGNIFSSLCVVFHI